MNVKQIEVLGKGTSHPDSFLFAISALWQNWVDVWSSVIYKVLAVHLAMAAELLSCLKMIHCNLLRFETVPK